MTDLKKLVRDTMDAYNAGDPQPLIATFDPNIRYSIVDLERDYIGFAAVSNLARQGAGQTRFLINTITVSGSLVSFTYHHESFVAGIEHHGPGLAVQKYGPHGKLLHQWAFRSRASSEAPTDENLPTAVTPEGDIS